MMVCVNCRCQNFTYISQNSSSSSSIRYNPDGSKTIELNVALSYKCNNCGQTKAIHSHMEHTYKEMYRHTPSGKLVRDIVELGYSDR